MGFTSAVIVVAHSPNAHFGNKEAVTYIHGFVGITITLLDVGWGNISFYCYTHIVTPLFNLIIHNMIHTYNEYHLGDQLVHLNYLRQVCKENPHLEFTHHCNEQHHAQLLPLCEGVPISLQGLSIPPGAINAWIGRNNYFYNHPLRENWVAFHLDWFDHLSDLLEIASPIASRDDLLFDYPALNVPIPITFDYLIINSPPLSNQLPSYDPEFFNKRVRKLLNEGKSVITTHPTGMGMSTLEMKLDVSGIGALSKYCKHIEGVATGPMWTTFNIFNKDKVLSRIFYCAHQTVNLTDSTITLHSL